jgi:hypothetical protein
MTRQECGFARARALTPERRTEIARGAIRARWAARKFRFCRGPCERELPLDPSTPKICAECQRLEWRLEARRKYWRKKARVVARNARAA